MGRKNPYYKLIILSLFLVGNLCCYAQKDSLTLSEKFDLNRREFTYSIVSTLDYVITVNQDSRPSEIDISILNKENLELINEFNWSKTGPKYMDHEIKILEYLNGQVLILSTSISGDKETKYVWLTSLSIEGAELKHTLLKAFQPKGKNVRYTFELFKNKAQNHVGISLVDERAKEFYLDLFVIDLSLEIIKEKQITLGNIKKVNYPHSFILTDAGYVFFLNGLKEEKTAEQSNVGLENRLYQLFRYDPYDDKLKQYDVTIADKFVSDVKMKLDEDENLYIAGFYNESHNKGAEGVFLMVINEEDGTILKSGKRSMDMKIMNTFLTEKQLRKSSSIEDLYLDQFYINEDGSITLIAEIFFVEQRLISSPNAINITTSYYYNWEDILVLEIDENLNYVDHQRIKKLQKSTNMISPYWSYSLMEQDNGKKSIFFNSNRQGNGVISSVSPNRSYSYVYDIQTSVKEEITEFRDLKIAPLFNSYFMSSYGIIQNKNHYRIFQIEPNN